jgi:hypothetical protein
MLHDIDQIVESLPVGNSRRSSPRASMPAALRSAVAAREIKVKSSQIKEIKAVQASFFCFRTAGRSLPFPGVARTRQSRPVVSNRT